MSLIHTEYSLLENNFKKKKQKPQNTLLLLHGTQKDFTARIKKEFLIVFSLR